MAARLALLLSAFLPAAAPAPAAAAATAPGAAEEAAALLVRTPFGLVHAACVRGLASGSLVEELATGHVRVRHADGAQELVEPCAHEPRASRDAVTERRRSAQLLQRGAGKTAAAQAAQAARSEPASASALANSPCHDYPPPSTCPPVWAGWPEHWWFGLWWAPFTSPPMPPNTTVYALNATWTVPDLPPDSTANASDPWFQTEPTESWWVGLQGGAVLQPVMELNGLMPHAYDAVSWNCCMGNMAWYSFPLIALPGETISGEIVRVSGAEVDAADSLYVYATVTGVSSAARGTQQTVLYSAMRQGDASWVPDWAEIVQESYFVTSCPRLPCGAGAFANLRLATAPGGLPFNETTPTFNGSVPWSPSYEVDRASPPGQPVCGGAATYSDAAATASVSFDCSAPH